MHAAQGRSELNILFAEATEIAIQGCRPVITLVGADEIVADTAVVATGNELQPTSDEPWSRAPWSAANPRDLKAPSAVVLLGIGLPMIDFVQSLLAAGFPGTLIAISRRGLLPEVSSPIECQPTFRGPTPANLVD